MKFVTFVRESNDFSDILSDPVLKKHLKYKIRWKNSLRLCIPKDSEVMSYVEIKYGEDIVDKLVPDRSPIIDVDYLPKR
jgi:hypothetical protein